MFEGYKTRLSYCGILDFFIYMRYNFNEILWDNALICEIGDVVGCINA